MAPTRRAWSGPAARSAGYAPALKEHRSQLVGWDPGEMLAQWAEEQGKARGIKAAEAFRVMVLVQDQET